MRPWYVQIESNTRGHALVVMLAYLIIRHLQHAWAGLVLTVGEGLKQLTTLCTTQIVVQGKVRCSQIPAPLLVVFLLDIRLRFSYVEITQKRVLIIER
jgi:hypothetical protein